MGKDVRGALFNYIEKMPALPTSMSKIMEVCNDPASSPAELGRVISLDPVLMGRVMKLINSAYYGLNNQVTSLVRAIIMLGFNTVKNLALSTAVLGTVGRTGSQVKKMENFWLHSLSTGVTAKLIAKKRGEPARYLEEFFVGGLLHDIGKVPFLDRYPEGYEETIKYSLEGSFSLLEGETHHFACNHTELGEKIAASWELSENLRHVIAHHHDAYLGPHQTLVYSVAVANYFTNTMGNGLSGARYPRKMELEILDYLMISLDDLNNMQDEIRAALEKARVFLQQVDK